MAKRRLSALYGDTLIAHDRADFFRLLRLYFRDDSKIGFTVGSIRGEASVFTSSPKSDILFGDIEDFLDSLVGGLDVSTDVKGYFFIKAFIRVGERRSGEASPAEKARMSRLQKRLSGVLKEIDSLSEEINAGMEYGFVSPAKAKRLFSAYKKIKSSKKWATTISRIDDFYVLAEKLGVPLPPDFHEADGLDASSFRSLRGFSRELSPREAAARVAERQVLLGEAAKLRDDIGELSEDTGLMYDSGSIDVEGYIWK